MSFYVCPKIWDISFLYPNKHKYMTPNPNIEEMNDFVTFMQQQIQEKRACNKVKTSVNYHSALRSFNRFLEAKGHSTRIPFELLTDELVTDYEAYLLQERGITKNSSSFYLRALHAVYKRGVDSFRLRLPDPFSHAYTGVDKTDKRAVNLDIIVKLMKCNVIDTRLEFCRDLFVFSFFARGIAFIDLAVCGLTLEQGVKALAYLQPRKFKVGENERGGNTYEGRCTLTISGYGELVLRERAGQIRHADNPVIVYEGDEFSFTDQGDVKKVSYTLNMNHNPNHIVACYLRITRADGSIDYSVMLESDWKRLEGYSSKANKYWDSDAHKYVEKANSLYSSGANGGIDTGFLMAKCIKHAFKTYPKVRIGKGTTFEADHEPEQEEDFYQVEESSGSTGITGNGAADSFAEPKNTEAGVTVEPGEDDTF